MSILETTKFLFGVKTSAPGSEESLLQACQREYMGFQNRGALYGPKTMGYKDLTIRPPPKILHISHMKSPQASKPLEASWKQFALLI